MEIQSTVFILSNQLQNLSPDEVCGVLQVALFASKPVGLQKERWGLILKVTGSDRVGKVGGNTESLVPDPTVMSRGIQGLRRDGVEQKSRRAGL